MNSCILPCRALVFAVSAAFALPLFGGVNVLTEHNDNARTGANLAEMELTPANVNWRQFGKQFTHPVDGCVHAQPLVLTGVTIPGKGVHDVVFVATEHNTVYAFDANNATGANAAPLWSTSFNDPLHGVIPVEPAYAPTQLDGPETGISATPVIDAATGTLYVVAKTETHDVLINSYEFDCKLHALDVRTGAEKPGSPVSISAKTSGLNYLDQLNVYTINGGLLLHNNTVYISFGGRPNNSDVWSGWIVGYNKSTLTQTAVFSTGPGAQGSNLAREGAGLCTDAKGFIYCATEYAGPFGGSVLKLAAPAGGGLNLVDYFTPRNGLPSTMSNQGAVANLMVLPTVRGANPNRLLATDGYGSVLLLDRDNLGQLNLSGDKVLRSYATVTGQAHNPALFNGKAYLHGDGDFPKAVDLETGLISPVFDDYLAQARGAAPSISASGASNGIVWEAGEFLVAYDAAKMTVPNYQLYASNENGDDNLGEMPARAKPTVANGKVYVCSRTEFAAYGLHRHTEPFLLISSSVGGGAGAFSGPVVGKTELTVNNQYTITAVPDAFSVFVGWFSREPGSSFEVELGYSPTLTFTMKTHMVLEAIFARNLYLNAAGTYSGLAVEPKTFGYAGGAVTFTLARTGAFTAAIDFQGQRLVVKNDFHGGYAFTTTLLRKGKPPATLNLHIGLAAPETLQLTGEISDGMSSARITANREIESRTAARYTLVLGNSEEQPFAQGNGYGTVSVTNKGRLTAVGVLPDGTAFTQNTVASPPRESDAEGSVAWTLFTSLYGGKGSVYGEVSFPFAHGINPYPVAADWYKPAGTTPAIVTYVYVQAAKYNPAQAPLVNFGARSVFTADGGNLTPVPILKEFGQGPGNSIALINGSTGLTLKIQSATGIVYGSFTDAANKAHAYTGVLAQVQTTRFFGLFRSGLYTGSVVSAPGP